MKLGEWHVDAHCPRCRSDQAQLQCTLRSSAVYFCRDCRHDWEVQTLIASPTPPLAFNYTSRP